jgi:hypothetical protein
MSRWLKITIFSIVLLLVFSSNQFFVKAVGISDSIRSGLSEAQVNASLPSYDTSAVPLPVLLGRVIGYALSFAGILFFGLSLYGGFLWMTSRGNADTAEKGKETVIASVIGVVIIAGSYALTGFVLSSVQTTQSGTSEQQNQSISCGYSTNGCEAGEKCSVNNVCISEGTCLADGDCLNGMVCSDRLCTTIFSNPSSEQRIWCVSKVCPRGTSRSGLDCSWSNGVRIITLPISGKTCEDLNVTECQNYINYCDLNNTSVPQQ